MKQQLLAYWENLNEREKIALGCAIIIVIIYLFYMLMYLPLKNAVNLSSQELQDQRSTLFWMKKVQKESILLNKHPQNIDSAKLLAVLAAEFKNSKFENYPYQMQQQNSGAISIHFDRVAYNWFVSWLWQFNQTYLIHIKELSLESTPSSGVVKIDLLILP